MSDFYHKNTYPESMNQLWEKEPEEGQRVVVDYGIATNSNAWWKDGKFVNMYGFELHQIIGWKPFTKAEKE